MTQSEEVDGSTLSDGIEEGVSKRRCRYLLQQLQKRLLVDG